MTRFTRFGVTAAGVFAMAMSVTIAAAAQSRTIPRVTAQPYVAIPTVAGKENFEAYCAVCHGKDAKGNGPAAPGMKAPVPDLTRLAARRGGQFDARAVENIIRGINKTPNPAHGVEEMPIWGYVFDPYYSDREVTTLRVTNLARYLESIQQR
jgi:mono/diheme cytochrome c family protein